jgi:hypothetical protein
MNRFMTEDGFQLYFNGDYWTDGDLQFKNYNDKPIICFEDNMPVYLIGKLINKEQARW